MNDNKNSKARHARHAAPPPQPDGGDVQGGPMPAGQAVPPKPEATGSAAPDKDPGKATPGAPAPGKPAPDQTAVMPQPVRPVMPNAKAKPGGQPGQPAFAGGPMLPVDVSEADAKGGRKSLKALGIVLGVIVALLAVVYLAGALVFMDRFLPRTTVGDLDVSLKSSAEVQGLLADVIDDYVLKVEGQGFSLKLSAAEAGMRLDGRAATDAMHASANAWAWPIEILKAHDESDKLAATYNESGLGDTVRAAVDEFNKTATPPTDAVIAYSEAKGAFIVEPEAVGTALSYDAVIKAVDDAVLALQPTVKLGTDVLQQPKVLSSDPKLTAAAEQANTMIKADLVLTMAGGTAGEVNADLISQWVRLGDDLSATLDEAALTAWVDELAAACNTVGTQRTYTRPDGKVVTVAGGVYGWSVDRDALLNLVKESVAAGTVQTAEVPCTSVGTGYNGAGAQDWGLRYCDIDLAEQYARFYDETGALIWESPIVSGIPDGVHDTSVGVYWLNQKASPSKLIGYENGKKIYESDVQYWMPFVGNVIGLHDADWQSSFGGTRYRDGAGSHGCVNLPPYKAAELYGIIQSGDVVVSHW